MGATMRWAASHDGVTLRDGRWQVRVRSKRDGDWSLDAGRADRLGAARSAVLVGVSVTVWTLAPWLLAAPILTVLLDVMPQRTAALVAVTCGSWALWIAPAVLGLVLRRNKRGRSLLRWHGAEHVAVDGALVTARCGTVAHSRAAAWQFAILVVILAVAPDARASSLMTGAELSWLGALLRLSLGAAVLMSAARYPPDRPDPASAWLQRQLVSPPESWQVEACRAAARDGAALGSGTLSG